MQIELKRGGAAALVDTHGAELFSYLTPEKEQVLWGGSPDSWPGRSPVLFPLVGAVKGRVLRIDGRQTPVKNHGFGRDLDYAVIARSDVSVTLRAQADEATLAVYPYPFALEITHALTGAGFVTRYRVTNTGDRPLSYCIGGHVGFCCPRGKGAFEDYDLLLPERADLRLMPAQPGPLPDQQPSRLLLPQVEGFGLDRPLFDQGTLYLEQPGLHSITLRDRRSGHGVSMSYAGFPVMALWTKERAGAPFLCIEPWHGLPEMEGESGLFEEKPYRIPLAPGESRALEYAVAVF